MNDFYWTTEESDFKTYIFAFLFFLAKVRKLPSNLTSESTLLPSLMVKQMLTVITEEDGKHLLLKNLVETKSL